LRVAKIDGAGLIVFAYFGVVSTQAGFRVAHAINQALVFVEFCAMGIILAHRVCAERVDIRVQLIDTSHLWVTAIFCTKVTIVADFTVVETTAVSL